jgi:hypothetical protein
MSKAGDFEIKVLQMGQNSCKWFVNYRGDRLITLGSSIMQFDHDELTDLKYCIEKAMQEIARQIGRENIYI